MTNLKNKKRGRKTIFKKFKMKKTTNIIGGVLFYLLLPVTFLTYIIYDGFKKEKKEKEIDKPTFHTYYPEDPAKDFNGWSDHIYKIRNSKIHYN